MSTLPKNLRELTSVGEIFTSGNKKYLRIKDIPQLINAAIMATGTSDIVLAVDLETYELIPLFPDYTDEKWFDKGDMKNV